MSGGVFLSHLAGPVEVLLVLGEAVEREEGIAVAGGSVADAVALPQQAALPDNLAAVHRVLQVLVVLEDLGDDKPTV